MVNEKKNGREKDMQSKMLQFQLLQATHQTLRQQMEAALGRANELAQTRLALQSLGGVKPAQAFIPLGSDNFVPGKIESSESILVSIGGDVAVKKTRAEALGILEERLGEMEKHMQETGQQIAVVEAEISRLQPQIEGMLRR